MKFARATGSRGETMSDGWQEKQKSGLAVEDSASAARAAVAATPVWQE
jgi:hypothetical protein